MAYRAVMFWVRLAFKVFWWGSILAVGLWVYNRGVDGFADDVKALMEFAAGEYDRFSGDVKSFQAQKERELKMRQQGRGNRW